MIKKFIGIFSGAGGLDYGFKNAGWSPIMLMDFWAPAVETLKLNNPQTVVLGCDVSTLTKGEFNTILKTNSINAEEIDAVIGGPPCQTFSRLNQNQLFVDGEESEININDPRRSLFMDFLRIVGYIKPKFVIMENVYDIATRKLGGSGEDKDKLIVDIIKEEFSDANYNVVCGVLNAKDFNTPQSRRRMIFIGVRKNLNIIPSLPKTGVLCTSVRDEFAKISIDSPNQELKKHSIEWKDKIKNIPEGGYYKHLPTKMKTLKQVSKKFVFSYVGQDRKFCFDNNGTLVEFQTVVKHTNGKITILAVMGNDTYTKIALCKIIGDLPLYRIMPRMGTYLRRIRWDISHTITRNPLIHPSHHRELSVREKASIQTFPPWYQFYGSIQDQHILVGNAVPCNMASIIAQHIGTFNES